MIPLKLTNFVLKNEPFKIINDKIFKFFSLNYKGHKDMNYFKEELTIRKWSDLYEMLEGSNIFAMGIYIVIDDVDSINSFLYFKKQLAKVFAMANFIENIRIILVSNFNAVKSELRSAFDFSSFVTVAFPQRNKTETIEIINNVLTDISVESDKCADIINKCVGHFEYPLVNLNEIIYCTQENVEMFTKSAAEQNIENIADMMSSIEINNNNKYKKTYDNLKLMQSIRQQIQYSPLHIKKWPDENEGLVNNTNQNNNINNTIKENALMHSGKNLTENLSKSQKILLLSSFLAYETNPINDIYMFVNKKSRNKIHTKRKTLNPSSNTGYSLKSKAEYPFHIHRLLSYYAGVKSILNIEEKFNNYDINIELIADISTLTHLNLIRIIKGGDNNIMTQKYIPCIGIDFAINIAEDFRIKLDDFITYDKHL